MNADQLTLGPPAGDTPPRAPAASASAKPRTPDPTPDDDQGDDRSALAEARERERVRQAKLSARAPRGFDPAALFLLDLHPDNLYDPTPSDERFVCRGCGATVGRRQRVKHHTDHKRRATK